MASLIFLLRDLEGMVPLMLENVRMAKIFDGKSMVFDE
jgi:hypothetical protein